MEKPNALVLTGFGINCEFETAHALTLGGAQCEFVHFNQLMLGEKNLEDFQILALPGGFSFGDDIASGRVLANKFRYKLYAPLRKFAEDGKPIVGICNGFQVLVQLGALPGWGDWSERAMTLMRNASGRFEDRWVKMRVERSSCTFAQGCEFITAPVRHGEGQVALKDKKSLERLLENNQVPFRYAGADGLASQSYPSNPNGSADSIAGVCNEAGNVIGLMPHPECHVRYAQSPHWTKNPPVIQSKKDAGLLASITSALFPKSAPSDDGNSLEFFRGISSAGKKFM